MNRRTALKASLGTTLALALVQQVGAQTMDANSQASFDTVMAFMDAMGKGEREQMSSLMADDMVWHNEGDQTLPWIGETRGKEEIFKFLEVFSSNLKTTLWETPAAFAVVDPVAVFGTMNGITTKSGNETGVFTFALRAKVRNGKIVLWNWFEDSFAMSQAYHGRS
ncbi:MAG: nuclear transport factor 2 family protein [Pseudomonadota bacterium]